MKYEDEYGPEAAAILAVARAARHLERLCPNVSAGDILERIQPAANDWQIVLIDAALDFEERAERAAQPARTGSVPYVEIAAAVTKEHGETFAEEWFRLTRESGTAWEAISATRLLTWPTAADRGARTPDQDRHHVIENEIAERTLEAVRRSVVEAFVRIAGEVLARERQRQQGA